MLISFHPEVKEEKLSDRRSKFTVSPLEPGVGYTLGNSLRRTLLSAIPGAAITSLRMEGVLHEFTAVPGMVEDIVEFILNIKNIVVSNDFDEAGLMYLRKTGAGPVTAGDIECPTGVSVHNPGLHLATLTDEADINIEFQVERGRGYVPAPAQGGRGTSDIGRIPVDSIYSPVLKVSYKVEATRVEGRTDFDKLEVIVETKESMTPATAFASAGRTLTNYFGLVAAINPDAEGLELPPSEHATMLQEQLMMPIEALDLSVRSYNCLKREGIDTVGALISLSAADLADIRNFGSKSIDEVREKLESMGLSLKDSPLGYNPSAIIDTYDFDEPEAVEFAPVAVDAIVEDQAQSIDAFAETEEL
ncbi:MAG: DNA-directed RNA polymerase subunit alpha [Actinomycetes bacterium]